MTSKSEEANSILLAKRDIIDAVERLVEVIHNYATRAEIAEALMKELEIERAALRKATEAHVKELDAENAAQTKRIAELESVINQIASCESGYPGDITPEEAQAEATARNEASDDCGVDELRAILDKGAPCPLAKPREGE